MVWLCSDLFHEHKEVLMIRSNYSVWWSDPSGGIEKGETPEESLV